MTKKCDACESQTAERSVGGAALCRACWVLVSEEITETHGQLYWKQQMSTGWVGLEMARPTHRRRAKGDEIMTKKCDACETQTAERSVGGAALCRACWVLVSEEIKAQHEAGKQPNALGIARRIYRETHNAGNYALRDIPGDLWDAAKHRAVDERVSLRELILKALRAYLKSTK